MKNIISACLGVIVTVYFRFNIFREEEYLAHTKCISEQERYGGKDYVAKAGANKGERKQQEWICVVNNLLNGAMNLSNAEKNFLNSLSRFENIPRKKAKFLNFVKNALGNRQNMTLVESVWNKMETAHKQNQQTTAQCQEPDNCKSLIISQIQSKQGAHQMCPLDQISFYKKLLLYT